MVVVVVVLEGGVVGKEDIVKIIRLRHTLQVHGERFTASLSLAVKFITE